MSDVPENSPLPENPVAPPPAPEPAIAAPATESGLPPNIAAGLAECFMLVGGLVFYFIEKKNPYIRFHALQSAYLGGLGVGLSIVGTILAMIPFIGWLLGVILFFATPLLGLAFAVVWIISTIQAFGGKEWEMPWLGKLARKHLAEGKFFFVKSPDL